MDFFVKTINGFELLPNFAKSSISDAGLGSEYKTLWYAEKNFV